MASRTAQNGDLVSALHEGDSQVGRMLACGNNVGMKRLIKNQNVHSIRVSNSQYGIVKQENIIVVLKEQFKAPSGVQTTGSSSLNDVLSTTGDTSDLLEIADG